MRNSRAQCLSTISLTCFIYMASTLKPIVSDITSFKLGFSVVSSLSLSTSRQVMASVRSSSVISVGSLEINNDPSCKDTAIRKVFGSRLVANNDATGNTSLDSNKFCQLRIRSWRRLINGLSYLCWTHCSCDAGFAKRYSSCLTWHQISHLFQIETDELELPNSEVIQSFDGFLLGLEFGD